ncbi:MAG: hypothetical protein ACE5PO_03465 [Candidatus Bathyarchaeia archaeon]
MEVDLTLTAMRLGLVVMLTLALAVLAVAASTPTAVAQGDDFDHNACHASCHSEEGGGNQASIGFGQVNPWIRIPNPIAPFIIVGS